MEVFLFRCKSRIIPNLN